MIILGIDPGTANTGFGVISKIPDSKGAHQSGREGGGLSSKNRNKIECLDYGLIQTSPLLSTGERLKKLNNELNKLIKKYKPGLISVENVYFFKNLKTAMPVSQAKGVVLLTAAKKKIPVCEIAPLEVKMTIVGYGRASKKQVQKMIERLLSLKEPLKSDDAADALGIAICGVLKNRF